MSEFSKAQASAEPQPPGLDSGSTKSAVVMLSTTAGIGERLDRFLATALRAHGVEVSRTQVQRWIALGAVQRQGAEEQVLGAAYRLRGIEQLEVECLPREADDSFAPDPVPLEVVAQSPGWLVINKPAGLVMHPGAGNWRNTLMNGLLHHYPESLALPRAGIVHRLDKDTSGLLVVARTESARTHLIDQLAQRTMGRLYVAWCAGWIAEQGSAHGAIGRDPRQRLRMAVTSQGKVAHTEWLRLAKSGDASSPTSWVVCKLHTGRTHQIRVHLAHANHPLHGDELYRGSMHVFKRQALHAWNLHFIDPDDGGLRRFEAPAPVDLQLGHRALFGQELEAMLAAARLDARIAATLKGWLT
jgi:23S rRNA pseudouridine1911/1915/1917 synthase